MKRIHSKWNKHVIATGGTAIASVLFSFLIPIPQWNGNFIFGVVILIMSITTVCILNLYKYTLVKDDRIVDKNRAVVIDSLAIIVGLIITWIITYIPRPFSLEEMLHPNIKEKIVPLGAYIITFLLNIPMFLTSERVREYAKRQSSHELKTTFEIYDVDETKKGEK